MGEIARVGESETARDRTAGEMSPLSILWRAFTPLWASPPLFSSPPFTDERAHRCGNRQRKVCPNFDVDILEKFPAGAVLPNHALNVARPYQPGQNTVRQG